MKAYVLVNVAAGQALTLAEQVRQVPGIVEADVITGEYDLVVTCEADDIISLGTLLVDRVQRLEGVFKTTTCLVTR